jgi:hypothetical protein
MKASIIRIKKPRNNEAKPYLAIETKKGMIYYELILRPRLIPKSHNYSGYKLSEDFDIKF